MTEQRSNPLSSIHPNILQDLKRSGLTPDDLNVRPADITEMGICNVKAFSELAPADATKPEPTAYVIPYYSFTGEPIPFYRLRILKRLPGQPKYKQPKNTLNHVYFSPGFQKACKHPAIPNILIMTEGEKKAAALCKAGFAAVGFGGVDSWVNRTLLLPKTVALTQTAAGEIKAKLSPEQAQQIALALKDSDKAKGFTEILQYLKANPKTNVIIAYDSDAKEQAKEQVQIAAARLGHELRRAGLNTQKIRQLLLPRPADTKMGIDDYLVQEGHEKLKALILELLGKRTAFPRHPDVREFVRTQLALGSRLSRDGINKLALTIITDLDCRGRRLRQSESSNLYYFNEELSTLVPVVFPLGAKFSGYPESLFGRFLYNQYGITASDKSLLNWLATQYSGEAPVEEARPRRVLAAVPHEGHALALQISDSQFVVVRADENNPLQIYSNGSLGILFEQGHVEPIKAEDIIKSFQRVKSETRGSLKNWWYDVIGGLSFAGGDSVKLLTSILFYISPWLNRWKEVQLPAEIVTGEAGSGKTSLYTLRLNVLTGRSILRNAPSDIRDWHASVVNTGGLHVTDNVQFTNRDLRQKLSDEICRLVTSPQPYVEMRRLYTTNEQFRAPIYCVFALTSIQRPFATVDLLQRSVLIDLLAIETKKDGYWVTHQLKAYGGRTMWLAHHLYALHLFLKRVETEWDNNYKGQHRLALYEQALIIMARVFGQEEELIKAHAQTQQVNLNAMSEEDWAFAGIKEFASQLSMGTQVTVTDITAWAQSNEDFYTNTQLTNAFRLGKYMIARAHSIAQVTGLKQCGKLHNKTAYRKFAPTAAI